MLKYLFVVSDFVFCSSIQASLFTYAPVVPPSPSSCSVTYFPLHLRPSCPTLSLLLVFFQLLPSSLTPQLSHPLPPRVLSLTSLFTYAPVVPPSPSSLCSVTYIPLHLRPSCPTLSLLLVFFQLHPSSLMPQLSHPLPPCVLSITSLFTYAPVVPPSPSSLCSFNYIPLHLRPSCPTLSLLLVFCHLLPSSLTPQLSHPLPPPCVLSLTSLFTYAPVVPPSPSSLCSFNYIPLHLRPSCPTLSLLLVFFQLHPSSLTPQLSHPLPPPCVLSITSLFTYAPVVPPSPSSLCSVNYIPLHLRPSCPTLSLLLVFCQLHPSSLTPQLFHPLPPPCVLSITSLFTYAPVVPPSPSSLCSFNYFPLHLCPSCPTLSLLLVFFQLLPSSLMPQLSHPLPPPCVLSITSLFTYAPVVPPSPSSLCSFNYFPLHLCPSCPTLSLLLVFFQLLPSSLTPQLSHPLPPPCVLSLTSLFTYAPVVPPSPSSCSVTYFPLHLRPSCPTLSLLLVFCHLHPSSLTPQLSHPLPPPCVLSITSLFTYAPVVPPSPSSLCSFNYFPLHLRPSCPTLSLLLVFCHLLPSSLTPQLSHPLPPPCVLSLTSLFTYTPVVPPSPSSLCSVTYFPLHLCPSCPTLSLLLVFCHLLPSSLTPQLSHPLPPHCVLSLTSLFTYAPVVPPSPSSLCSFNYFPLHLRPSCPTLSLLLVFCHLLPSSLTPQLSHHLPPPCVLSLTSLFTYTPVVPPSPSSLCSVTYFPLHLRPSCPTLSLLLVFCHLLPSSLTPQLSHPLPPPCVLSLTSLFTYAPVVPPSPSSLCSVTYFPLHLRPSCPTLSLLLVFCHLLPSSLMPQLSHPLPPPCVLSLTSLFTYAPVVPPSPSSCSVTYFPLHLRPSCPTLSLLLVFFQLLPSSLTPQLSHTLPPRVLSLTSLFTYAPVVPPSPSSLCSFNYFPLHLRPSCPTLSLLLVFFQLLPSSLTPQLSHPLPPPCVLSLTSLFTYAPVVPPSPSSCSVTYFPLHLRPSCPTLSLLLVFFQLLPSSLTPQLSHTLPPRVLSLTSLFTYAPVVPPSPSSLCSFNYFPLHLRPSCPTLSLLLVFFQLLPSSLTPQLSHPLPPPCVLSLTSLFTYAPVVPPSPSSLCSFNYFPLHLRPSCPTLSLLLVFCHLHPSSLTPQLSHPLPPPCVLSLTSLFTYAPVVPPSPSSLCSVTYIPLHLRPSCSTLSLLLVFFQLLPSSLTPQLSHPLPPPCVLSLTSLFTYAPVVPPSPSSLCSFNYFPLHLRPSRAHRGWVVISLGW